jgi:hypothetical protein
MPEPWTTSGNPDFYNAAEFFIKSNVSLEAIVAKIKEFV